MNILAIVAHPRISESRLHRSWANALEDTNAITVRKLYHIYPYWHIETAVEQGLLTAADRIVLQFPFYLYGCPPLMKLWMEDVLSFRWAYGPGGSALHGKQVLIAISTGGPAESYVAGGYHNYTVEELLAPFRQIVNLIGAVYLKPYVFHRARTVGDAEISASAADYARYVLRPDLEALPPRP
ncbi:MAG: NAD(P)H-dependent oxidoreductase [Rhodospirillaceae bacterium]